MYVCIPYIPSLEIPQEIGILLILKFSKLLDQNLLKVTTVCVICAKYSFILTKTVTTLFKCVIDNHCIYQVLTRRQPGISSAQRGLNQEPSNSYATPYPTRPLSV